jgi:hypothetical protein
VLFGENGDEVAYGLDRLAAKDGYAVHALGQLAEFGRMPTLVIRRQWLSRPLFSAFDVDGDRDELLNRVIVRLRLHDEWLGGGIEVVDVEREVDHRHNPAVPLPVDRVAGENAGELEQDVVVVLQRRVPLGGESCAFVVLELEGVADGRGTVPSPPGSSLPILRRSLIRSPSRNADCWVGCLMPTTRPRS